MNRMDAIMAYLSGVALIAGAVATVWATPANQVSGVYPRVVDGDTLAFGSDYVRLYGIDAPEILQTCTMASGTEFNCGTIARDTLGGLIGDQEVICARKDKDRWGRIIATCAAGGQDLGRAMVRSGWALAYRHYSDTYIADEQDARYSGIGLWATTFEEPWLWRSQRQK